MDRPYVSRVGSALIFSVKKRLELLRAHEYPTESAARLADLLLGAVNGIEAALSTLSTEREKQFAIEAVVSLGEHLRYLESASSIHVPVSLIPPFEQVTSKLIAQSSVLLRVKPS